MAKKPKKVLVVEYDSKIADLLRDLLVDEGYQVLLAKDSPEGLRVAREKQPDLVIVDYVLPTMKGQTVARTLRRDPMTNHQRILLLAEESELENLVIGAKSSVDDFLIRPFDPADVMGKVKPLLIAPEDEKTKLISTGNMDLDGKMGGGIPVGSLTLIEGDSGAGKSVLGQQMMRGCLTDGFKLSIFSSENTVRSLVKQMRSLNLDILDYLLLGSLRVFSIETSTLGRQAIPTLVSAMKHEKGRDMVFVDSLTSSIPQSSDNEVLAFFEESKRLCSDGTTIITIVHSHGLSRELLTRVRSLCDAHLRLRTEEVGSKLVKTLEVTKVRGADQATGNIVSFEVEPGWGMRVIPINKVKA
jgi:archaeal flagellar protein FlaH